MLNYELGNVYQFVDIKRKDSVKWKVKKINDSHMVILVDEGLHDVIQQNLSIPYSRHYFLYLLESEGSL